MGNKDTSRALVLVVLLSVMIFVPLASYWASHDSIAEMGKVSLSPEESANQYSLCQKNCTDAIEEVVAGCGGDPLGLGDDGVNSDLEDCVMLYAETHNECMNACEEFA